MPINRVGCSMTRLLCLRLHAKPSGATLDIAHGETGHPFRAASGSSVKGAKADTANTHRLVPKAPPLAGPGQQPWPYFPSRLARAENGHEVYRTVSERQPDPPVDVVIPPRSTAAPSVDAGTAPSQRDRHVQLIRDKGRMAWQKATGYGRRSLGETAMSRYKALIGRGLRARTLPAQKTEAGVGCAALNRMTRLGMPVARRVA